jgi:membrane protein DedA with SNARE-associated domain
VLWVGVWVSVGDLAGDHITTIYTEATRYLLYVLIVLVVAVAALVGRHVLRHRRAAAGNPDQPAPSPSAEDA